MDISRFCLEIEGFQDRTGKTQEEAAKAFGVSLAYLRNVLYKSKPLTIHLVEKVAPVLGLTVHDFILGESTNQPGEPARDEAFGNIMGILGKNLTPESRAAMIEMAKAAQVKGRERLEAEKKNKAAED
jgi:transcriptional regulator with XRE-family HTH domain